MRRSLVALLLALAPCRIAAAQTPFFHQGLDPLHPPDSALPNEQVDPASGTLTVVATDLVLPGNAGFNLAIQRVYNSSIFPNYNSGDTTVEERSWAGVGWKLHFGRILHADSQSAGQMEVEMGDGSRHPLYHSLSNPNIWTTTDFWLYNPATAVLQLPNGQVYTFGREVYLNDQLGDVRYVTEIDDPFGNAITFGYFTAPDAPIDGIASIHQTINATESRDVTFTYDSTLHALASMTFRNHTWNYTETPYGPGGDPLLARVTPPQGPYTAYDYGGALAGELTTIAAPFGGSITYTYQDATRVASGYSTKTRVVATRTMSGHGVTTGTWTFAYGQGSNQDTTVITCPCGGTTSYRFDGTGVSGNFSAWHAGTLGEMTVVQGSATLEDQVLTYVNSDAISNDPVTGPNGVWSDAAVYRPLLSTRSVTRDGHTWSTSNRYHIGDGSLNDHGQPYEIDEEGENNPYLTRTTTRTFQTGFTPYILGPLASETVSENSAYGQNDGTITSSWSYDLSTGFVAAQTHLGITTTFEERADGNVNAVIDARGNRTAFGYDWGRVGSIQTPNTTTTLTIAPEGLVTAQTRGDVTTTYGYDYALRLATVQTTGTNAVNYSYDDLHGAWIRETRGSSSIEHDVDGFGREVKTFNSLGLQFDTWRDTCGRVTGVTDTYTSTPTTHGLTYVYDALGRVTQFTNNTGVLTTYHWNGIDYSTTDGNNHVNEFDSIAFGDPSEARLWRVLDANGGDTQYAYDVTGVLVRSIGPGPLNQYGPPTGPTRTWAVQNGRVTSETQPESGTTSYTYDEVGNRKTVTDANGTVTTLTYDGDNRLTNRDAPGTVDDLTITYDSSGRVHTLTGGGTTTTYTYDVLNRTVTRSDVTAIGTYSSTYQNDPNDNLSQITYPTGRVVAYSYDTENRLLAVNYTAPGSQTSTPFATSFSYGDDGRLASYVTGAVTHQFTNVGGRPLHMFTTGGTGSLDLTYGYDPAGNVSAITDPRPNASQSFGTDALDRLTTATGPWGSLQWTYDVAGNRLTQAAANGTTTYHYDAPTQRLTSTSGAQTESFWYDSVGQVTGDGVISQYVYSPTGNLTSATGSGVSVAYSYDAAGERLSSAVGGQTFYTLRGIGGETLSEYLDSCGTAVWTRDLIYAGGQLLGAAKAAATLPMVSLDASTANVGEAAGSATVTVRLTTPGGVALGCPVTVSYGTTPGTATEGADYTRTAGSFTFASGSANGAAQTLSVPIVSDALNEGNETFSVNLTGVDGGTLGLTAQTVVTILDDDPTPSLSINNVTQYEGNSGTTAFTFTVNLSAPSGQTVQVSYATWDVTAIAGSDYQLTTGTLTIPAGASAGTITVPVYGDGTFEPNETFTLALSSPVHATLTVSSGTGTILNDDMARRTWGDFYTPRDGSADGAVINASTNVWTFRDSNTGALQTFGPFGNVSAGNIPVAADYDGDGITDCAYYSAGIWHIAPACNLANAYTVSYGGDPSDIPVPADYDGDGRADIAVYCASTGYWYVLYSSGGELIYPFGWTWTTTIPVPGDYDGDGRADLAYYAQYNSSWWILPSSAGGTWVTDGTIGNTPVIVTTGDFDGDGRRDTAYFYPGNSSFYVVLAASRVSSDNGGTGQWYTFGSGSMTPVSADYDGDGKTDLALFDPSTQQVWVWRSTTQTVTSFSLAGSGTVPVLQRPQ